MQRNAATVMDMYIRQEFRDVSREPSRAAPEDAGDEPRRLRPGGSRSFVVRDPDGHEIVLVES